MSEWLKEHAWKACVGETLPWVRIPLSPPIRCFGFAARADRTRVPEGRFPLLRLSRPEVLRNLAAHQVTPVVDGHTRCIVSHFIYSAGVGASKRRAQADGCAKEW